MVYVQWWIWDYHSMKILCDEYSIFHISQSLFNECVQGAKQKRKKMLHLQYFHNKSYKVTGCYELLLMGKKVITYIWFIVKMLKKYCVHFTSQEKYEYVK